MQQKMASNYEYVPLYHVKHMALKKLKRKHSRWLLLLHFMQCVEKKT